MSEFMDNVLSSVRSDEHPYYHFEPWDIEERPDWVKEQARKDGIDLYTDEMMKHAGNDPRDFQSGYFHSKAFIRIIMAGSQVGKSMCPKYEIPMMLTGVYPIAFRHAKGEDTGVARFKSVENIIRFGRRNPDGEILDHDPERVDDTSHEWDCGNIVGAGVYDPTKMAPEGSTIWVGTFQKALDQYWWPSFEDGARQIIPPELIDRKRGNKGFAKSDGKMKVFLIRGGEICFITYESGYERFEALNLWHIVLDEEPKDPRIFAACQERCKFLSMIETPYQGITWTRKLAYPKEISPDKRLFHATQYDSPYQNKEMIDVRRKNNPPWEVGARVWGIPTEVQGLPYFDRLKISTWYNKYDMPFEWKAFVATSEFFDMEQQSHSSLPGMMDVEVKPHVRAEDNRMTTWRVYEDVKPGVAYLMPADPAEGSENPDEAQDVCAALIVRPPSEELNDNGTRKETHPVIVASLRSTLQTTPFALCCAQAAKYYNNALMCAESRRAGCNVMFHSELKNYPYWYQFTSVNEKSQKQQTKDGFDMNAKTREVVFHYVEKWIGEFQDEQYPGIPDRPLLKELAAAVVGKNGRPDHTKKGTLDTAVCFGIILYILDVSLDQVRYNGPAIKKTVRARNRFDMARALLSSQPSTVMGLDNMGYRRS